MGNTADTLRRTRDYLSVSAQFRLGELPTERPHPLTSDLSRLAREAPGEALRLLHRVDADALDILGSRLARLTALAGRVRDTLAAGGAIHLAGCGSTGRLSLACETLWRRAQAGSPLADRVRAFMAGGDLALVRSLESFEDHPEYGGRQLEEMGFRDGDLLLASTEGGETPFVIGAALRAAALSSNRPVFLFCNPEDVLRRAADRSARVLSDPRIETLCLPTGPMALSGSTRLQASTVLMAAVGAALLHHDDPRRLAGWVRALAVRWRALDTGFLAPFVAGESAHCGAGGRVRYVADADLAVTVLTDTAERAPTFSLLPFGNDREGGGDPSLCSLRVAGAADAASAWRDILAREPRGLDWPNLGGRATLDLLLGFDFSRDPASLGIAAASAEFRLARADGRIMLRLGEAEGGFAAGPDALGDHLVLKMLLNAHSTLVMGRLGRFDGNLMTWVRPSNHKLVDRAIRYADLLLRREGLAVHYARLAEACFALQAELPPDRPLVHAMVERLRGEEARLGERGFAWTG